MVADGSHELSSSTSVPSGLVLAQSWNGVDIQAETRSRAAKNGLGQSVHEWLETYLSAQPRRGKHRLDPLERWFRRDSGLRRDRDSPDGPGGC